MVCVCVIVAQGDLSSATGCITAALEEAPDSEHLLLMKVEVLMAMKKYEDALAVTSAMLRGNVTSTKMLQYRARCFYFQVRVRDACALRARNSFERVWRFTVLVAGRPR